MNNIIDINKLIAEFKAEKSLQEWREFSTKQNDIIERYQKEIELLRTKNQQLEMMLISKSQIVSPITSEEAICLQQIRYLETESNKRPLTLEEVKRLDLLVKNLKLIREESTIIVKNNNADELGEIDLVAIASRTE